MNEEFTLLNDVFAVGDVLFPHGVEEVVDLFGLQRSKEKDVADGLFQTLSLFGSLRVDGNFLVVGVIVFGIVPFGGDGHAS